MSLERCLLKHRDALKNPEKAEIVAAKQEYMSRGMSEHEAAVQAIKDQIRAVEKQRADIVEEGMKQWKAQDPETYNTPATKEGTPAVREHKNQRGLDQVLYEAIADGASAEELLTHISRQSKDAFISSYAKYLRKHVKGVKVRIGNLETDDLSLPEEYGSDIKERMGAIYNNLTRTVSIYSTPDQVYIYELVLHELTHAASMDALESDSPYAAEMNRLLEAARKKSGKMEEKQMKDGSTEERWNHYGFTNVKEFIAEAFSNPEFQQVLMNTPATSAAKNKVSVWTMFKDAIFRALGLKNEIRSIFDEIMDSSEGLFEDNTYLQQQEMAGLEGNVATVAQQLTPEFKEWFGNSKAVNSDGKPQRYYTGTSKDKDFKSFNVPRNGTWFVDNPSHASEYARENDSKGYKQDGWKLTPINTADRVIPVYLKIENPFTGPMPDKFLKMENYKRAQSIWFDELRAQGYDGWMPDRDNLANQLTGKDTIAVVLGDANQIKSAVGNKGTFSSKDDMVASVGRPKDELIDTGFHKTIADSKTLGEALTKMLRMKSLDDSQRSVVQHLLRQKYVPDAKLTFGKDSLLRKMYVAGTYHPFDHSVNLNFMANANTLIHEAVHAATLFGLDAHIDDETGQPKTEVGKTLINIYEQAKDAMPGSSVTYGFTHIAEFVAEAMSNKSFQSRLQAIKLGQEKKTAFQAFVDWVKKLLRIPVEGRSALDSAIDMTNIAMQSNPAAKEIYDAQPEDISPADQAIGGQLFSKANDLIEGNTKLIDALGSLRRGKMYVQFLRDLKDNYGSLLQDSNGNSILGAYVDRAFSMAATANELLKAGGNIAERWNELKAEKQVLSDLAADATISGIHPDLPLNAQEYEASNGRKISNKTLANEDGVFPESVQTQHAELQARYMKLSDRAKKVYKDARDHMADNWNKREALLNKRINDVYQPLIDESKRVGNTGKVAELTKERDEFIEEHGKTLARVSGPYFPLSRFGDYYVVKKSTQYTEAEAKAKEASEALRELYVKYDIPLGTRKELEALNTALPRGGKIETLSPEVKEEFKAARKAVREANKAIDALVADGSHYSNEAFESEGEATQRAAELGVDVMLKEQYFKELSPITQTFLNRISDAVAGALPEKQALEAREAMTQIWIKSLPDTSAMRSQLRRRKVEGFSTDMLRAFSKNAQTDAHYLSRLEHMDALTSELMGMKDASKKPGVPLQGKELYNEIARRHVENMQYVDTPIANAISGISFVWQLGISPAFLLTNLSQPWMLSMPFMSGRHGIFRASNELGKAFKQVAAAVATSVKAEKSLFFEIDKSKFTADEQKMLAEAQRQGLLDITLEYDLSAMSKGTQNRLTQASRIISAVPHQVEVINRVMTALAAYRMEKQKSGHAEAIKYVIRVLDKTHIDYSATNAPSPLKPGFWGGLGKVMFQYRKYQLGMLSLLANQAKAASNGSKEAQRALVGLFAMHGALAGALGLPLAGSAIFIANMVNKAFGDADEPWDAEVEFRNWLADVFGVEAGAVAAKGIPMLAGLDVSRRIGLGSIAAPIQVVRGNKKGRDFWLEVLASASGPTLGGLMPNMADGVNKMGQGDFLKGAALMLPNAISAPIKAYQLNEDGIKTAQGVTAVKPDRIDAWDVALQSMGLNPSIVTERSAAVSAVENLKTDLRARAGQLEKAWVNARMKGDQEAVAEAKAEIDAYNEARRKNGQPIIKPADLINAYRQRQQGEKAMSEQGVRQDKRSKALSSQGRFADVS